MLSQVMQDAINDQINAEFYSSYLYLAMSAYCQHHQFSGSARWLQLQSQEEYGHAMRLLNFLAARHGRITLQAIEQPPVDYDSVPAVFQQVLTHEQAVTASIDRLYELAFNEKAFSTMIETEWFVTEQVEEEKTSREIAHKMQMLKDDPASLLDLDRELGQRGAPTSPPSTTAPGG